MKYIYYTNKRATTQLKKLYKEYQIIDCYSDNRFIAKINDTIIKIFSNNKVLIINDVNEFKKIAFIELKYNKRNIIKEQNSYVENNKQLKYKKIKETTKYNEYSTIGVDEVGVSEYMYPLVVASVFVPKEKIKLLESLGVRDSKELTKEEILRIGSKLTNLFEFNTQILSNRDYNKIYNNNYTKLKINMFNKSIISLDFNNVDYIIIDAFTNNKNYYDNTLNKDYINKTILINKADKYVLSVCAASIIAKYTLYLELNKLEDKYKVVIPSNKYEMVKLTKQLVKIHGENIINELCKKNFIFTHKILQELDEEKL